MMMRSHLTILTLTAMAVAHAQPVTHERLLNAAGEAKNWLMYNGDFAGRHYSGLASINAGNVKRLGLEWVFQARSLEKFESTPLVVDGVMYITEAPNNVGALDPVTGRPFWIYEHKLPEGTLPCCGKVNRGVSIAGDTLYHGTHDAKLLALDAKSGRVKWETTVVDFKQGYALTHAPLVVRDKVIVGTAGGELGIRGFLAAYDARTGKELWRFKIIPEPGEKGSETWGGDSWKHGGGSIWVTGSYDPETNLTYWGTGNPGPDWNPGMRPGDNLYTDSVVALDADTGQLKWHFQFTPHDEWDWDAVQVPVLADIDFRGRKRKAMLWGNRNGFFYVLDRVTGQFLHGKPFVKQTWASGLDDKGRPMKIPGRGPTRQGTIAWPGVQGGTNWYAPSFSPRTGLFYLVAWEDYYSYYYAWDQEYEQGKWFTAGGVKAPVPPTNREAIVTRSPEHGYAAVRALEPATGKLAWEFKMQDMSEAGILTTASDLLFTGNREGYFFALDARTGGLLWKKYLGGQVIASPITYEANGEQYVGIASGTSFFAFKLMGER